MSDNNNGGFWAGFVLGGLTGAVITLLMTPQPGEMTRVQLKERGAGVRSQVGGIATNLQERGRVIIEERRPQSISTNLEDAADTLTGAGDEPSLEDTDT